MHHRASTVFGTLLILLFSTSSALRADTSGFFISGTFDDTINAQPQNAGSFTVNASQSNALVNITFDNGYRELVGTDGADSFLFIPFTNCPTCESTGETNSRAIIAPGRFPAEAHFLAQVLWIGTTHDPNLMTNLARLQCPFYGSFKPEDIRIVASSATNGSHEVHYIRWYAPNHFSNGTNRYENATYPAGWLMAEISFPSEEDYRNGGTSIRYVVYNTISETNVTTLRRLVANGGHGSNDVATNEVVTFTIVDGAPDKLPSYVPMLTSKSVRVNDKRTQVGWVMTTDGKWWKVGNVLQKQLQYSRRIRVLIVIGLGVALLLPLVWVIKGRWKLVRND